MSSSETMIKNLLKNQIKMKLPEGNSRRIRNVRIGRQRIQVGRNKQTFVPCHFRCSCRDFLSPCSLFPSRWHDKRRRANSSVMDNFHKTRRRNQKDTNKTFHLLFGCTNLHFDNGPRRQSRVFHSVHPSNPACSYILEAVDRTLKKYQVNNYIQF
jgi:hypothetical protein